MQCPNCKTELEYKAKSDKYYCHECEDMFTSDQLDSQNVPWPQTIAADIELWESAVWAADSVYPVIIAHEYRRLHDLYMAGQSYGALLQIKDLFEVLLKLPVLIVAALVYQQPKNRSSEGNRLLRDLLEKPVSLGDWEAIAGRVKKQTFTPLEIKAILKDIHTVYEPNKGLGITNWRNETIGHGALAFDDTPEFQQDLLRKIKAINDHLTKCAASYAEIRLQIKTGDGFRELCGPEDALGLEYDSSAEIYVRLGEGAAFCAYPYILLDQRGLYFFDCHFSGKQRSYIINYPEGQKKAGGLNMNQCWRALLADRESQVYQDGDLNRQRFSSLEEQIYQRIQAIDDFQKPDYISDWLYNAVEQRDRGILLLQMERGMGKSCYCRALDPFGMNISGMAPEETSVRVYYINDSYGSRLEYFCDHLKSLLKRPPLSSPGMNLLPEISSLPELGASSDIPQMLELLKEAQREHQSMFHCRRLLVVLDGLDEIPAAGKSIWDYLPAPDQLPPGVFMLLTSRSASELEAKPFSRDRLAGLQYSDTLLVTRDHPVVQEQIQSYIRQVILPERTTESGSDSVKEMEHSLMAKSGGRLLYLRAYRDLLRLQPRINELPPGEELMQSYLTEIEKQYSPKYFHRFIDTLMIIASAAEPLSLNEISFLLGDGGLTFRLLAYMNDARAFLQVERSYRGCSLHTIVHEDWRQGIMAYAPERMAILVEVWQNLVQSWTDNQDLLILQPGEEPKRWDGESYLLAHVYSYVKDYLASTQIFTGEFQDSLGFVLGQMSVKIHQWPEVALYIRARLVRAYSSYIVALDQEHGCVVNDRARKNDLARTYINRGNQYSDLHQWKEAEADYQTAISAMEMLADNGDLIEENDLAKVSISYGRLLWTLLRFKEAEYQYNKAIEIRERLLKGGFLEDDNGLAKAYMNRGILFNDMKSFDKSAGDFSKSIEIRKRRLKVDSPAEVNELAKVYLNRGIMNTSLELWEQAEKDYDMSINMRERLNQSGLLFDKNDLAKSYTNRGIFYSIRQRWEDALRDYNEAAVIRQVLRDTAKLVDENELARVYFNRGNAYYSMGHWNESLTEYGKAIEIQSRLSASGHMSNIQETTMAYVNRAIVSWSMSLNDESLADFATAISIAEQSRIHNAHINDDVLANIFMTRGNYFIECHDLNKALTDYNIAIMLKERLMGNGQLEDHKSIAQAYLNRGSIHISMRSNKDAYHDYDSAIHIYTEMKKDSIEFDSHDLVHAYMNRGALDWGLGNLNKAESDYDLAIAHSGKHENEAIPGRLQKVHSALKNSIGISRRTKTQAVQGSDDNEKNCSLLKYLIHTYANRGILRRQRGNQAGYEADYGKAERLLKKLQSIDKSIDRRALMSKNVYLVNWVPSFRINQKGELITNNKYISDPHADNSMSSIIGLLFR